LKLQIYHSEHFKIENKINKTRSFEENLTFSYDQDRYFFSFGFSLSPQQALGQQMSLSHFALATDLLNLVSLLKFLVVLIKFARELGYGF
jgi:hypothetical protein